MWKGFGHEDGFSKCVQTFKKNQTQSAPTYSLYLDFTVILHNIQFHLGRVSTYISGR